MRSVFIEFVIKNRVEPIGTALLDSEGPLSSLRRRKGGVLKVTSDPKKNNKIVIPRTVLTHKRRRLKRQSKTQQQSSDEMLSESGNNEDMNYQSEENNGFSENQEPQDNIDEWDEEFDEGLDDEDILENEESNQNDFNGGSNEEGSEISLTGYENKKLTKRQWMSKNNIPDTAGTFHMQLPDKKPRKKRTLLMTEEQQIKKMEKEEKRRINTLKQIEEHKQQTVDKILNETGRMQKQRKEKEEKDALRKTNHIYKKLPEGDVIIRFISNKKGEKLFLDKTIPSGSWLLNDHELSFYGGEPKGRLNKCTSCNGFAKYRVEKPKRFYYCGVECFKKLKK